MFIGIILLALALAVLLIASRAGRKRISNSTRNSIIAIAILGGAVSIIGITVGMPF